MILDVYLTLNDIEIKINILMNSVKYATTQLLHYSDNIVDQQLSTHENVSF